MRASRLASNVFTPVKSVARNQLQNILRRLEWRLSRDAARFRIRLTSLQPMRSEPLREQNPQYDSQFHLAIRDVQTHETLWGLTETCPNGHSPREPRQKFRAGAGRNPLRIAKNHRSGAGCRETANKLVVLILASPDSAAMRFIRSNSIPSKRQGIPAPEFG